MSKPGRASIAVAAAFFLLFGLFAVFLGQDTGWDTLNYHVYNPYAFLNGRINVDLAPAQLQSYFSPVIDLPVYWLTQHVRPWLAGFWLGGFQGFNALLVFLIARALLSNGAAVPFWTPLLLACLGCLNASFVAQLGTGIGDSSSSPFVLLALLLACRWHAALRKVRSDSSRWAVWIGLLMGLAVGLKLTNAPFALAMVLVLAVLPITRGEKLREISWYGFSAAASFALTSGWWFYGVWLKFGNPLFPQFNNIFKAELATASSVIDTRWGPVNALEALAWPFWMSFRPWRIHDGLLYNHLWLIAYLVLLAGLASHLFRRWQGRCPAPPSALIVMVFTGTSYVIWLKLFSIGRYMTVIEILLPLLLLLGLRSVIWPRPALALTLMLSFLSLAMGVKHSNFGIRAAWGEQSYSVAVPSLDDPTSATILIAAGGEPTAWILPHFPKQTPVLRISGNFPRSSAYDNLIRQTLTARGGKVYAIIPTVVDWTALRAAQLNRRLDASRLLQLQPNCELLGQIAGMMDQYRQIDIEKAADGRCRANAHIDASMSLQEQTDLLTHSNLELAAVGYELVSGTCQDYSSFVGEMLLPYRLCHATKTSPRFPDPKPDT